MSAPLIDYEGFEDLDDHRFLWMALLHLDPMTYGWAEQEIYLTFDMKHPGVEMPKFVADQYPDMITIVLQHDYFDLKVSRSDMQVVVKFSGKACRIAAPWDAVLSYVDKRADFTRWHGPIGATMQEAPRLIAGNVVELFPGSMMREGE